MNNDKQLNEQKIALSTNHINNLNKASELSGNDILFRNNSPIPVNIHIDSDKENLIIETLEMFDDDSNITTVRLTDYDYIISMLILA